MRALNFVTKLAINIYQSLQFPNGMLAYFVKQLISYAYMVFDKGTKWAKAWALKLIAIAVYSRDITGFLTINVSRPCANNRFGIPPFPFIFPHFSISIHYYKNEGK